MVIFLLLLADGRDYFSLHFQETSVREVRARSQGKNLEAGFDAETMENGLAFLKAFSVCVVIHSRTTSTVLVSPTIC